MKILILGIGNILFGDEGIGVHLSNYLKVNYTFTPSDPSNPVEVEIVDGGTLAQMLIPLITSYDKVLILDCVSVDGAEIGDVYAFDLYIPLMAIFTFIVTVGFTAGTKGIFSPQIISTSLSACSVAIILEVVFLALILCSFSF